jgi:low temperature requirement protein LtrA
VTAQPLHGSAQAASTPARVSNVELFFDLVFVFTVTQLTAKLAEHPSAVGLAQVMLMLGVIWWMYAGYAWLTNAVAPNSAFRRGLLVAGMAGFLGVALAIPAAFGSAGWLFGLGYFVVNAVHTTLFVSLGDAGVLAALRGGLFGCNLATALLVLIGGFLPDHWRYAAWLAAFGLQLLTPYVSRIGGFTVSPTHFVERHGLVVIIALGESIVAIGVGAAGAHLDFGLVSVAVLALVVAYYQWWAYFGGAADERAEHELARRGPGLPRARAALHAFGYAHYPILLGIVAFAAGVKKAIGHADHELKPAAALALGGGVALFLFGHGLFRWILHLDGARFRAGAGVAALATVPLGTIMAVVQLAAIGLVLGLAHALEYRPGRSRESRAPA